MKKNPHLIHILFDVLKGRSLAILCLMSVFIPGSVFSTSVGAKASANDPEGIAAFASNEQGKEATLEETLEWLTEKLNQFSVVHKSTETTTTESGRMMKVDNSASSSIRFDKCNVIEKNQTSKSFYFDNNWSSTHSGERNSTVSLSAFDPANVKVEEGTLRLSKERFFYINLGKSSSKIKGVTNYTHQHKSDSTTYDRQEDFQEIFYCKIAHDEEMANRIAKAFQHAIKLCKKKEPF